MNPTGKFVLVLVVVALIIVGYVVASRTHNGPGNDESSEAVESGDTGVAGVPGSDGVDTGVEQDVKPPAEEPSDPEEKVNDNKPARKYEEEAQSVLVPNDLERQDKLNAVIRDWTKQDPEQAVDWVLTNLRVQDHVGYYALVEAARVWAKKAPEKAVEWSEGIRTRTGRMVFLYTVAGEWSSTEPAKAAEVLDMPVCKPFSMEKQMVLGAVVSNWARADLDAATKWGESITNRTERSMVLSMIANAKKKP